MATVVQRAKRARTDFGEFASFVGDIQLGAHQADWVEACQDIADNPTGGQKYVIIAPPGFGKSEVIAKLFTTFMIGRYPESHGAVLSYGNKPANTRSRAIRHVIKNDEAYRVTFPEIKPDPANWNAGEFTVQRRKSSIHPTMLCGGTKSAVVSYRINWLVLDDPIDQKQAANLDQRARAWDNYREAILTRLTRGAPQICISTRWSDDDFVSELLKDDDWVLIHAPALDASGRSVWPRGKTTRELLKLKHDEPELFQVQYQGDPGAKGIGIIKKVATYKDRPTPEWAAEKDLLIGAGWDTAYKDKEQNCYTVGYVGGLDKHQRIWVLDRRKARYTTPEVIDEIRAVQDMWDPYFQWVEDTAGGTSAVQVIQREVEEWLPLETIPPTQGGKRSRAHALGPYMHSARVLLPREEGWYEDAHYHLTKYPYISLTDDIDALHLLVTQLITQTHPAAYSRRDEHRMVMS